MDIYGGYFWNLEFLKNFILEILKILVKNNYAIVVY